MESKKPNPEVVKSLMVRTFAERRKNILGGGQMVAALCREYPFLKKAMYVSCFEFSVLLLCCELAYLLGISGNGLYCAEGEHF